MKSSMKKGVCQLPIIWCISICMDKAKLSVSTMGNKPAVNATSARKMAHGNAKPSRELVIVKSTEQAECLYSVCRLRSLAIRPKSASLQVRRTKQNALY